MLNCVCLRILASSRIPRYDPGRRTPHFWGGSVSLVDQEHRKLAPTSGRRHGWIESGGGADVSRDAGVQAASNNTSKVVCGRNGVLNPWFWFFFIFVYLFTLTNFVDHYNAHFVICFHDNSCFGSSFFSQFFVTKFPNSLVFVKTDWFLSVFETMRNP
jgi:hypothetical protein